MRNINILIILIICILNPKNSKAKTDNYQPYTEGQIVENKILVGNKKYAIKLPPGKFLVIATHQENSQNVTRYRLGLANFKEKTLYQFVDFYFTKQSPNGWIIHPASCNIENRYFHKKYVAGSKTYNCWSVSHYTWRFDRVRKGSFNEKIKKYFIDNKILYPEVIIYSQHAYSSFRHDRVRFRLRYYENPEISGVPKSNSISSLDIDYAPTKIFAHPKKKSFMEIYVGRSAKYQKDFEIGINMLKEHHLETSIALERLKAEEEAKRIAAQKIKAEEEAKRIAAQKIKAEEEAKRIAAEKIKAEEEAKIKEKEKKESKEKEEKREIARLEKSYGPKCKRGFFSKGYEKGTKEWIDCLKRKETEQVQKEKEREEIRQKIVTQNKPKAPIETAQTKDLKPSNYDQLRRIGSGTGFFVSGTADVITNNHVVKPCNAVESQTRGEKKFYYTVSIDPVNDLALIKGNYKSNNYLKIKKDGPNLGENIYAIGYPLGQILGSGVKISQGLVSALSGTKNNTSQIQISAPIQPGNSGGPVINNNAEVVGVAVSGLNKLAMAKERRYIPENVNFAVSSVSLNSFLRQNNVSIESSFFKRTYDSQELANLGDKATVQLFCLSTRENWERLRSQSKYSNMLFDTLE